MTYPPLEHDPNSEDMKRLIQFPLGSLATLLYLAERADTTNAAPPCNTDIEGEWCAYCTALEDAQSAMDEYGVRVNGHG